MDSVKSTSSSCSSIGENTTVDTTAPTEIDEDELLAGGTDDEGSITDLDEERLLNGNSDEEEVFAETSSSADDSSKADVGESLDYQTAVGESIMIIPATQTQNYTSDDSEVVPASQSFGADSISGSMEEHVPTESFTETGDYQQQQLRLSMEMESNSSAVMAPEEEFSNFEEFLSKRNSVVSSTPFAKHHVMFEDFTEDQSSLSGGRPSNLRPSYSYDGRSSMTLRDSVYETAGSHLEQMMEVDDKEMVPEAMEEELKDEPEAQVETPLEDSKIVKHILSYVTGGTARLLELRGVNRKWNVIIKEVLREQNKLCLRFRGDNTSVSIPTGNMYPQKALENLNSVLATAKDFPVRRIILCGVNLEDSEVQRFFKLHGSEVTHICIWFRPGTPKLHFYALLKERLKNLVLLQLLNLPVSWADETNTVILRGLKLPYLKTLRFDDACHGPNAVGAQDIIAAIMFGATKLEQLLNFPVYLNSVVSELDKTQLIRSLSFEPDSENGRSIETYSTILNFRHKLSSIRIMDLERHLGASDTWTAKYTEILELILYRNRKCLNFLCTQPLGSIPNFVLKGCYPALEKIYFHCFSETILRKCKKSYPFLPAESEMSTSKFPAVKKMEILNLNCKNFPVEFASDVFCENLFPGLTDLLIDFATTGSGTIDEWIRFGKIMPNVKKLTLKVGLSSIAGILDHIWRVWQVESIVVYIKEDGFQYSHPFLDSVITGLPEEICKKLRTGGKAPKKMLDPMRQSSSVMNCEKLKQFDWVFETGADYNKHIQTFPKIITEVAYTYGFCSKEIPVIGRYLRQTTNK